MQNPLSIDIWADIACPWCYVGERRLHAALRERPEIRPAFRWMPFQLQPGLPPEGLPWDEFVPGKFGGWDNARAAFAHVSEVGAADGIAFRFERVTRAPNTASAHRLLLWAQEHGKLPELSEALFRAYFTDGRDPADTETLVALAEETGLDANDARHWLTSGTGSFEVEQAAKIAGRMGITGVPFYVFGGRYALSGAQPVAAFLSALDATTTG
jgi:predicted DsbA family dithiol-disulfide isomerase